jgi:hypothetical protein
MNAGMQKVVEDIMDEMHSWVKGLATIARQVKDADSTQRLEQEVWEGGQRILGKLMQSMLQGALEQQKRPEHCPKCGHWWHSKGKRERGLVTRLGAVKVIGPYWCCPECGYGQHSLDLLATCSVSRLMREVLCMLGVGLGSFEKAALASQRLLGMRVSKDMIAGLCRKEGTVAMAKSADVVTAPPGCDLVGSCDGTMINTREESWKELKGYLWQHQQGVMGRAHLETVEQFAPRLRQSAIALGAAKAGRLIFVSDAAAWIDRAVEVQLPTAKRVVDIWHAYQHVHDAARTLYGEGTPGARTWAKKWCDHLRRHGGRVTWHCLRRVRHKELPRREALQALLTYLDRNAKRMDYPTFERRRYPISSGPMESFCKQLGRRLKGAGMRWTAANVSPMATMVSLWATDEWSTYWAKAS